MSQPADPSLLQSPEIVTAILESSHDGIVVAGPEGTILRVNSSYERITGITRDQVEGRHGRDLVRTGVLSDYLADRITASGQPVMMVQRYRTGRSAVVVGTPVTNGNGQLVGMVFTVRDVTELHALKSQLDATQEETERYRAEANQLRVEFRATGEVIAESRRMQELLHVVTVVARVDSSVLLLGESGVGKGLIARTIHNLSPRSRHSFVVVNCAALPETLLEAELFGYDGGSFTGALPQGKPGLFEVANDGTLFLDEVSEMSPALQVKLLHALQDREVRRVGATKPRRVNVRIIAATNRDLDALVRSGGFREDLYYRLNVIPLVIPPMRERPQDLLALLHHFLDRYNQRYKQNRSFTNEALTRMMEYHWPGNVRELENMVERLVVTAPGPAIRPEDLPASLRHDRRENRVIVTGLMPLDQAREEVDRQLFRLAAAQLGSSRRVAKALGVSQPTASRNLKRLQATGERERNR